MLDEEKILFLSHLISSMKENIIELEKSNEKKEEKITRILLDFVNEIEGNIFSINKDLNLVNSDFDESSSQYKK